MSKNINKKLSFYFLSIALALGVVFDANSQEFNSDDYITEDDAYSISAESEKVEGVAEGEGGVEEEILVIEQEELPWIAMQEPPKSDDNKLRIKYEEGNNKISLEDKIAIDSMIKLNEEAGLNFKIISYTSKTSTYENSLSLSILRLQKLAIYLKEKGFDYDENDFFAHSSEENDYEINYIDIDKL